MKKTFAALAAFVFAVGIVDGMFTAAQPSPPPAEAAEMEKMLREEHLVAEGLNALLNPRSRVEQALAEAEGR